MKRLLAYASSTLALTLALAQSARAAVGNTAIRVAKGETLNEDVVTSGPIVIEGTLNGDCVSLGGPADIRGEVSGDVASLGGPLTISGNVRGDVASVGGGIAVSGAVKGAVFALGGNVDLKDKAAVLGDVALLGGRLTRAPTATVKGEIAPNVLQGAQLRKLARLAPLLSRYGRQGDVPMALERVSLAIRLVRTLAFLAFIAGLGLLVVLMALFLPRQVEAVAAAVKEDFWTSAGIGALILMLIFPSLLLMVVSVLGIPLIPIAVLLLCAAKIMSLAAFSLILAERLYAALDKPAPSALARVGVGYGLLVSLLVLGKLVKLAGSIAGLLGGVLILANLMMLCCAIVVGLGAIWTTRMGSRQDGPTPAVPAAAPAGA